MTMSTTSSPSIDRAAATPAPPRQPPRRGRVSATVTGLVIAAAVAAWAAGVFDASHTRPAGVSDNNHPTSTTTVTRGTLVSQLTAQGTLQYTTPGGSNYTVVNQASGTFSQLPGAGERSARGEVLYRVSDAPVILLYGTTPTYRSLYEGDKGPDVRELNENLVALGYATKSGVDSDWAYFSAETAYALERLQYRLGEDQTGTLSEGQAVFVPGPIRITTVNATLGTTAAPGAAIMQATSTRRQVVVNLVVAQQSEVKVGDQVQITLPNGQSTPGVMTSIGTVASGTGSNTTLPVYIMLARPQVAGTLNQAPVTVQITTAKVKHALIVPVDALLALAGGGYALETVQPSGAHTLVAVSPGTFDDSAGTVQITGNVSAGERIVVPNV